MQRILLFVFCGLLLSNCTAPSSETEQASDNMAQFTKDEAFKEAHDVPKTIETDERGKMISFSTKTDKPGSAYALNHEFPTNKTVFVIHEWWGLNDHIKREAQDLFDNLDSTNVLALDLYDGNVATTREEATAYMEAVNDTRAEAIIQGALSHVGPATQIATIGWCFGGGWSLKASILAGVQSEACIIYYGMPVQEAKALLPLQAPILGIFAENDQWITPQVASKFEALAKATGKEITIHSFDADHAFANPSSERYKADKAQKANALALQFLKTEL